MTNKTPSSATGAVEAIKASTPQLMKYVPKGESPKIYLDLVRNAIMKPDRNGIARSDDDLMLFLYVAKRTGLDPLTRQIYAVYRWDSHQGREVMSIQTGIDGMRLVAQRTGEYAGQEDIKFSPKDELAPYPIKATCTVYRIVKGVQVAFSATARWNEYAVYRNSKDGGKTLETMWAKMPYNQLGKCAEALALRKGFPNELSGVYAEEEMAQSSNPLADLPAPTKGDDKSTPTAIVVEHGAPEGPVTIGAELPADKKVDEVTTPKPKEVVKDIANTITDMRKRAKEKMEIEAKKAEEAQPAK